MSHTAILLAGSRPGRDEFAASLGTDMKALIPVAGEPMILRPVEALLRSSNVSRLLILSQAPDRLSKIVPEDPRIGFLKSRGTIAETMLSICDDEGIQWPLLVTTADHALLEPDMVDELVRGAQGFDIAIGVVERANLMARIPQTRRTWLRFRGGAYTGANLFALRSPAVRPAVELWRSVEQDRKKAWRIMSLLGPVLLFFVSLRLLSLEDVLERLGARLGVALTAVVLSNPLAGLDVDKAADHDLVEAIIGGKA